MAFLNPGALWLLAAVLPAITALYFLKLRRQERVVSSTLLWRRSLRDLRVNAPLQRLRKNLLLLLQLLIAALAILALARPYTDLSAAAGRQAALVIDASASMATRDAGGRTRLEAAKERALAIIDALPDGGWGEGRASELCIIAAADRPLLLSGLTSDRTLLREAVRAIGQRSTETDMTAALEMAAAVTGVRRSMRRMEAGGGDAGAENPPAGEEEALSGRGGLESPTPTTDVILLSDGAFPPVPDRVAERLSAPATDGGAAGETDDEPERGSRYIRVGSPGTDNLGIVALSTREDPRRAGRRQLFVRLENTAPEAVDTRISLEIAGEFVDEKTESVPGRSAGDTGAANGSRGVVFDLSADALGPVRVRLLPGDAFGVDDEAFAVIEPPEPIAVLLVTEGNYFLETALRVNDRSIDYEVLAPGDWPAEGAPERAPGEPWELVLFDRFAPPVVPPGASVFIDAVPELPGLRERPESPLQYPAIYDWNRTHPILRHLSLLDRIAVLSCRNLAFEGGWAELLFAEAVYAEEPDALETEEDWLAAPARETVLLGALVTEDRRVAVLGFDLLQTREWVLRPGFPLFIRNAIHWLARPGGLQRAVALRTGSTVRVSYPDPVKTVTVHPPEGPPRQPPMAGPRSVYFSHTHEPGIYRVRARGQAERLYAFSLLSSGESAVRARDTVRLGSAAVTAEADATRESRELWPVLALLALGVLLAEWYVYNIRILG
jgi:hypothetical protein